MLEGIMLVLQAGACIESACRGLWWKTLYWFGAFFLTLAIVKGLKS